MIVVGKRLLGMSVHISEHHYISSRKHFKVEQVYMINELLPIIRLAKIFTFKWNHKTVLTHVYANIHK